MASTFGDIWKMVRLHAPQAPATLVQNWVQSAYAELTDSRPWSWVVEPVQLVWQDARLGLAVTVTAGSPTVTSAGLFLSADVGRQFRVGTAPIYTILSRTDANTITLDQNYEGAETGAVEGNILDAYTTMPVTFGAFTALVDPVNQRYIPWWGLQDEIDLIDPVRNATADRPRLLASLALSQLPSTLGQPRYEYWPIPTSAGSLQGFMRIRPESLSDTTPLKGVLAQRPDILETGALARCAKWPGLATAPNPYFNLALARTLSDDFHTLSNQLDLRDDDMYPQSLDKIPWQKWSTWTWAYDTHLLQQTDATLNAYWGMGLYPNW